MSAPAAIEGRRVLVQGLVQGVGFRPYVHRLASSLALVGTVANGPAEVTIDVYGDATRLDAFLTRLPAEAPAAARVESVRVLPLAMESATAMGQGFRCRPSETGRSGQRQVVQADAVTCAECLGDVLEPGNRRFGYPFTACTQCGPRFTIVEDLPYDRVRTTLRGFPLCGPCRAEYEDPADRRFHAEAIACAVCGPQLEAYVPGRGDAVVKGAAALPRAAQVLGRGGLVALKGLGGWQLICVAGQSAAVERLRGLKARPEKPLAVMAPDLASVRGVVRVSPLEERALASPEGPIVLLARTGPTEQVCEGVAPGIDLLGVMLPTTPLHHLLLRELGLWLVVTSGNVEGEPILIDDREARERLGDHVDLLLGHERPIAQRADDSVVRVASGEVVILRRARGYVARPVRVADPLPACVAVGGHLKATVALAQGREVVVSPHLGDLDSPGARAAHAEVVRDYLRREPSASVACDLHPDYASTRLAEGLGRPLARVQHHQAHALAVWAEAGCGQSALAITWDGSGWGPDGTVWGGEAFRLRRPTIEHFARLRPFRLPGGEQAVREPRRAAFGLLHALGGAALIEELVPELPCLASFTSGERAVLVRALERGLNAPWASSVGRLFDAVAALLGLTLRSSYEAQAALRLERCAAAFDGFSGGGAYALALAEAPGGGPLQLDWEPLVWSLLADLRASAPLARLAAAFHAGLASAVVALARRAGEEQILLAGGCFQNVRLLEETHDQLVEAGFRVAWPRELPPNDGGLALGQLVGSAWAQERA